MNWGLFLLLATINYVRLSMTLTACQLYNTFIDGTLCHPMAFGKLPEIFSTPVIGPYLALLSPENTQALPHLTR